MRVLGKDGGEDWVKLYEETPNGVINDLSSGKYDVTVTTGPSYDTQRMEFVDALTQISQGSPEIAPIVADLIVGASDFPKAEQAAERLKLMLPPQIQQMLAEGKEASPEVMQLKAQMEQMGQQAEQQMQELSMALQEAQQKAQSNEAAIMKARTDEAKLAIEWFNAETKRLEVMQKDGHANDQLQFKALQEMGRAEEAERGREFQAQSQMAEQVGQQPEQ
jgi:hypothetical protein